VRKLHKCSANALKSLYIRCGIDVESLWNRCVDARQTLSIVAHPFCDRCAITVETIRNRFADALKLLCNFFIIACNCRAIDRKGTQHNRCTIDYLFSIVLHLLYNRFAIALQSLRDRFEIASQSLRNRFEIALQSLHNRCTNAALLNAVEHSGLL
jgi:hypothetical protein